MNWTKLAISTIIGGVVYFFLGWLIYGIILTDVTGMTAEMSAVVEYPEEEFKISFMILSCLIWAALLSFIFIRWANISTFMGGLKAGAIIGFAYALAMGFSMVSMYKFASPEGALINAVGEIACSGIAGGAIGWYLGRGK